MPPIFGRVAITLGIGPHSSYHCFWTTVCKTVRPVLSDHCLSRPVYPPLTLVYCDQTVLWIDVKLGVEVGLGPGHIVLDG